MRSSELSAVEHVLNFWFKQLAPAQWWVKDPDLDAMIKQRYLTLHQQAKQCELFSWRDCARGRLAEIIILDQFSRNMYIPMLPEDAKSARQIVPRC